MNARTLAVAASLTVHATMFAAATSGDPRAGGAAPAAATAHEEAEVTVDLVDSPAPPETFVEATPALVDAPPPAAPATHHSFASRMATSAPRRAADVHALPGPAASQTVAAAPADTADAPRFTIAIGAVGVSANHPPAGTIATAASSRDTDGAPVAEGDASAPARLARGGAPSYPERARRDGIEADVPLEIIVSPSGVVESAHPMHSAHAGYEFEEAAMAAVRQYLFQPAIKDGHPVRVRMRWVMQFRLW